MAWDIGDSSFRIVLSAGVVEVINQFLGGDVLGLLIDNDFHDAVARASHSF